MSEFSYEGLYALLEGRNKERPEGSYTTYLFEKGLDKILKKVGEECTEVIIAAKDQDHTERLTLWQAVMSLSGDLRAAVTLFYYDGLSIREISGALGISEAAVKTRLSRGLAKLRQLLEEE